jgi:hypothetical protein
MPRAAATTFGLSLQTSAHPMTAAEYSKIRSVLERIAGLRRAMVVTGVVGVITSLLVFEIVSSSDLLTSSPDAFPAGFWYGALAFTPFVATIGYLSSRVSHHIERLARGKYEQLVPVDQA